MIPILAGYYYRKAALKSPDEVKIWNNTGLNFFKSIEQVSTPEYIQYFTMLAIEAYEKVKKMDPSNLDAKANLAQCYIYTATGMPVEAIGILKENLQVNPDHKLSLLYLAMGDKRIGQYDKAIDRFKRLIELDPGNVYYYPYLIGTYKDAGKLNEATSTFEKYKKLEKDPEFVSRVEALLHDNNK